jgi:hypothetical protein
VADNLGVGNVDAASAACIANDAADRLFHDTDCDNTKDDGENYIDVSASGSGGYYGALYHDSHGTPQTISIAAANTYVGWTSATAGPLMDLTADTSDATADHLTIPSDGAGDYYVSFFMEGGPSASGPHMHWTVAVDGAESVVSCTQQRVANTLMGCNAASILTLAAGDELSVRVENLTDANDAAYRTIQMTAQRVNNGIIAGQSAAYATIYDDNTAGDAVLTNAVAGTWYGFVDATELNASGVTVDTSDATADSFTIQQAGTYIVSYSISHDISAESQQYEFGVFLNDAEVPSFTAISYKDNGASGTSFRYPASSRTGTLELSVGDKVDLRRRNITGTSTFLLNSLMFAIHKPGTAPAYTGAQGIYRITPDQSVANGAWDQIEWNTDVVDPLDWHDPSTNPSRITVDKAGWYHIMAMPRFTAGETANIRLIKNGASDDAGVQFVPALGAFERYPFTWWIELDAGDYVEVDLFISGGATLDSGNDNANTNLIVTRLPTASASSSTEYGEMYESATPGNTINLTVAGTYYGWVSGTEGLTSSNVAFTDNGTADRLTISGTGAGVYSVDFMSSFTGSASVVVHSSLFINGVEQTKCEAERKLSASGDVGNAGFHCLVDLDADDYIDIRYKGDGTTKTVTINHSTLTIERLRQ